MSFMGTAFVASRGGSLLSIILLIGTKTCARKRIFGIGAKKSISKTPASGILIQVCLISDSIIAHFRGRTLIG